MLISQTNDITFAVPVERVNKEYIFELSFGKKRKVYPLLMRRTRPLSLQKYVFMFESLNDLVCINQEIDMFSRNIQQKSLVEASTEVDSCVQDLYSLPGKLLIIMDDFLKSEIETSITGNKVTIDDLRNALGLKDALQTFLNKNRKMTDGEYEKLIGNWIQDDEYCINDSIDDPLN